ncbi:uncharacterized protein [Amphiura filiformis]|uniref:uncharacterized protein n=1 Tax=Amphiura filiformis TaxID=82378 RepID=UPI003B21FFF4
MSSNSKFSHEVVVLIIGLVAFLVTFGTAQNPSQDGTSQMQPSNTACHTVLMTGPAGPPGVQGPQGLTGPAGDPGIPGVPGQSGIPGLKGDLGQGSPGQQGVPGLKGVMGLQGLPGNQGIPGKTGPKGERGLKGSSGVEGQSGSSGQSGVKGEKGEPGVLPASTAMSAFSARVQRDLTSAGVISFAQEDVDIANDFNPSTGIFTCSIPGIIIFHSICGDMK